MWNRCKVVPFSHIKNDHIDECKTFYNRDSKQRICGAHRDTDSYSDCGQRKSNNDFSDLFNQLRNGGRHHVLLSLHKATERAENAYNGDTRCNHLKAWHGFRKIDSLCKCTA